METEQTHRISRAANPITFPTNPVAHRRIGVTGNSGHGIKDEYKKTAHPAY